MTHEPKALKIFCDKHLSVKLVNLFINSGNTERVNSTPSFFLFFSETCDNVFVLGQSSVKLWLHMYGRKCSEESAILKLKILIKTEIFEKRFVSLFSSPSRRYC